MLISLLNFVLKHLIQLLLRLACKFFVTTAFKVVFISGLLKREVSTLD